MKKLFSIALVFSLIIAICPLGVFADEYSGTCGESVSWSLDPATGILTISGEGNMTDYDTDWELFAPWNNYSGMITAVVIEEGVTSIGSDAFSWCTALMTAEIPEGVTVIGEGALKYCFALVDLYIPASVEAIGDMAFVSCKALETITVHEDNEIFESIGSCLIEKSSGTLLYGCKYSEIPQDGSIKAIADFAFSDRAGLSSVTIPDGIKSIGEQAFTGCSALTSINLPDSLESIGSHAFNYCSGISGEITIPEKVTVIENGLFQACKSISKFNLHGNIQSIGISAFSECSGITEIDIPDSVQAIGRNAFYSCSDLTSIDIPEGVTTIGSSTFRYCFDLKSISLPEGLTAIQSDAFSDCERLNNVILPESLTVLENYAFKNCKALESITVPKNVTSIGNGAFMGCTSLAEVVIPEGVTSIGSSAFAKCALTEITIPVSITSIDANAFNNCDSLDTVIYAGTEEDWNAISIDDTNTNLNDAYQASKCEHAWGEPTEILGTCMDAGEILTPCESCGAVSVEYTELDPDNHVWDEGVAESDPTCTETGLTRYTCIGCGEEKTEDTDALGHGKGEWRVLADGTKEKVCTVCGEVIETLGADEYIPNDVNGDNAVNMYDYLAVKTIFFRGSDNEELIARADVNGSGKVDMFDYLAVKAAYFAL